MGHHESPIIKLFELYIAIIYLDSSQLKLLLWVLKWYLYCFFNIVDNVKNTGCKNFYLPFSVKQAISWIKN